MKSLLAVETSADLYRNRVINEGPSVVYRFVILRAECPAVLHEATLVAGGIRAATGVRSLPGS
jgi:hypothetical protein